MPSGPHDGYTLWEAPDNVSMAAVALAITGGSALSSLETTALLTVEETMDALRKADQSSIERPGRSGFLLMRPNDLGQGVVPAEDAGGLPRSMLDAIEQAGGLWHAGDYYADPATNIRSVHARGVRALRIDARDLALLAELPQIEFLHCGRTAG